jgi:hypothetical protein
MEKHDSHLFDVNLNKHCDEREMNISHFSLLSEHWNGTLAQTSMENHVLCLLHLIKERRNDNAMKAKRIPTNFTLSVRTVTKLLPKVQWKIIILDLSTISRNNELRMKEPEVELLLSPQRRNIRKTADEKD